MVSNPEGLTRRVVTLTWHRYAMLFALTSITVLSTALGAKVYNISNWTNTPTVLPTPTPTSLPSQSLAPSSFWCNAGFGFANGTGGRCSLCPAGKYREAESLQRECQSCPGGRVPKGGTCFLGTKHESLVSANGTITHSANVVDFGGSCYYFGQKNMYWTSAERSCRALGGHLACLNGHTEATALAKIFWQRGVDSFWIGLSERGNEKSFEWTNAHCCSPYRNWFESDQPSGHTTREPTEDTDLESFRCVRSDSNAKLHDENCRTYRRYVCEAPVESGGSNCALCRKGSFASAGSTECAACPFGRFTPEDGMESCVACPTMSPAAMLARHFGQAGSVQCGGKLGRAQRTAYVFTIASTLVAPPVLSLAVVGMQVFVGGALAQCGVAAWPTRSEGARRKIAAVSGTFVLAFGIMGGALFANWLKPFRQNIEDWPYRGRGAQTSELMACDPVKRHPYLICTIFCLLVVIFSVIAAVPILNIMSVVRAFQTHLALLQLRRQFEHETNKWTIERSAHDRAFKGGRQASFACTLCGQSRANALNLPCGHQFLCRDCAINFRMENTNICNSCREPSDIYVVGNRPTVRARRTWDYRKWTSHRQNERPCTLPHSLINLGAIKRWRKRWDTLPADGSRNNQSGGGNAPRSPARIDLNSFDSASASVCELRAAIAATKNMRACAHQHVLASTCGSCAQVKPLVVDIPCGHANLCAECAYAFRAKAGMEICSRCGTASTLQESVLELSCSCCLDVVNAEYLVALGSCGHQLCTACSIGYVRSALANVAEQILATGVRCPVGSSKYADEVQQCSGIVTSAVVERLVTRAVRPDVGNSVLPLKPEELVRLKRFISEAAIPLHERFYCCWVDCSRLFAVENRDHLVQHGARASLPFQPRRAAQRCNRLVVRRHPLALHRLTACNGAPPEQAATDSERASGEVDTNNPVENSVRYDREEPAAYDGADLEASFNGSPPFVTCPWCSRSSCVRCKTPAHSLLSCSEVKNGGHSILETNALVEATSKPCPQCNFRITHHHGHACHHIRPGTGCPNCGTHFCYRCLKRGSSGLNCGCRLFCRSNDIIMFISKRPYPHDTRCGCPLCPDCRPGVPCSQCTGGCVVCRGDVPPGPISAAQIESWTCA